jgi:hypothetical protein
MKVCKISLCYFFICKRFLAGIPFDNIRFNSTSLLHEVPVVIRNMEYCFTPENQSKTKICAGGEMQGVTGGDSGGPLAIVRNNRWAQYGVTSYGRFTGVQGKTDRLINHGKEISFSYFNQTSHYYRSFYKIKCIL